MIPPPTTPKYRAQKRNCNFEQVWLSSIYKTKIRIMDNFLICLNLITEHQGKSYLVIRWRKHTPLARQVATGRGAVLSSSRCSRNERGVPSPARSKWERQTLRASRVPALSASEVSRLQNGKSAAGAVRSAKPLVVREGIGSWRKGNWEKGQRERERDNWIL